MPAFMPQAQLHPTVSGAMVPIRQFQPGDEADFLRLNEEWIVRHFVLEAKDRAVLGDPVRYILSVGGRILFATAEGETIGCCALVPEAAGEYEVAKMAVSPDHRGRGIGRVLLEAVIAEGRALGASRLHLETNSKLPAATHLYESVGFRHIPPDRVKPSLYARADVYMEMILKA